MSTKKWSSLNPISLSSYHPIFLHPIINYLKRLLYSLITIYFLPVVLKPTPMFSLLISILSRSPMTFQLLNQCLLIRTHLSSPISHMIPLKTLPCGFLAPHSSPVPPSCLAEHVFVTLRAPNLTNAQDLVWTTNTAVAT